MDGVWIYGIPFSPENMEPYTWVRTATHVPRPSGETSCTITLANHFTTPVSASPSVAFWSSVFSDIGKITASPHMGGQAEHERLIELIEGKEAIEKEEAKNIQAQQLEMEKGFLRLYSAHAPVETRPPKKVQQAHKVQNKERKLQIKSRALQIKSLWKAKIKRIFSRSSLNQGVN